MKAPSLLLATLFAFSPALLHADEGFIIPVDRPLKVGDKLKMSIEGEALSNMKVVRNVGGVCVARWKS